MTEGPAVHFLDRPGQIVREKQTPLAFSRPNVAYYFFAGSLVILDCDSCTCCISMIGSLNLNLNIIRNIQQMHQN